MKKRIIIFTSLIIVLFCTITFGCKKPDKKNEVQLKFVVEENVVSEKKVEKGYTIVKDDFPENPSKQDYTFAGWYVDTLKISAGYVVNDNTTVKAKFEKSGEPLKQDGSIEYPYLISTAQDLVNFADRINHMDEETEDENYHLAHFALNSDIDMSNINYIPAGKEITIDKGDEQVQTIYGFMGEFDGRGHTISNLKVSINMKTNREYLGGLFGLTKMAYIHDLKLSNIDYEVEAGSDDANRSISMGGVVGLSILSVFENIDVTGKISTYIFDNNGAFFGGIAGKWEVSDSSKSYYAYAKNCHTNIETLIGEIEGEKCSLENAVNGGLFGYISNYNSAAAIINSITEGSIDGGKYVGGLVGYAASSNTSILDSASYAKVSASSVSASYTGGLVGMAASDMIIKDCFFAGPLVRGTRSTSNYKSYAGGLVGYSVEDDYELYYTGGLACINSYYKTIVRGANTISSNGNATEENINLDFVKKTLKWEAEAWKEEQKGEQTILVGVPQDISDKTYEVKFIVDGETVDTITKNANEILGQIPLAENKGSNIFYNWVMANDTIYRSYMPVTKNIEVYGKYFDVTSIAGVYSGSGTLYETLDAGLLVLNDDGTLQWINSSTVSGKYKYDGEHIILDIYNGIGEVSGTLIDGNLKYKVSAGMSGDVSYDFNKIELSLFGEYFSEEGDIITFSSEGTLSFQSSKLRDGNYVNGTYTQIGNELTVTGEYLAQNYSSMSIVDNGDLTITVNFISKVDNLPSLQNVKFSKILNKDYSSYPFIGPYYFVYIGTSNPIYQTQYTLDLKEDGTANYISQFSSVECQYFVFNEGKTIKIIIEGYASEFTYDEENNFFYGLLNRGTAGAHRGIVLTPKEDGDIYGLVIDDIDNVLFATKNKYYLFENGIYQPNATAEIKSFENNTRITVNNEPYIIIYDKSEYTANIGYRLVKVGVEEGDYTYNGKTVHLDGIGGVSGDIEGIYQMYEDNLIVIITNDDKFIGFNLESTLANNKEIEIITPSIYQGVWFMDSKSDGELVSKYYKLLIDGYGHTAFMYLRYDEASGGPKYKYNWSEPSWVNIYETSTGLTCDYNKYQHCEMSFYYDYNLMYSTQFGYLGEVGMYKDGYTGSMLPPVLPSSAVGRYTGVDENNVPVVLNIRQDLNGSYAGNPFAASYDGVDTVIFKILNVVYRFNIKTLVLSYGESQITLISDGGIQEIIPEALCGVWTGTWEGIGSDQSTTLTIEKDGTIKYVEQTFVDVQYDYETNIITGTGVTASQDPVSIKIVYDADSGTINVVYTFEYDGETHTVEGKNLTKK